MLKILIVGASRGVGLSTVYKALEAGHEVRAMSRHANDIAITHRNLTKISADASSIEEVSSAVQGCDAVITSIGISPTRKPVSIFSECAKAVCQSMLQHNVKRLVAVTGLGAGDSRDIGGLLYSKLLRPMLLGPIYDDKDREEQIIRQTNLNWTIVRPGILTRLPKKGGCKVLVEKEDWEMGFISREDVADFLVNEVSDQKHLHQTPLIIN